jgi:parvulin-like peptidyl-prolyl isomerase
MKNYKHAVIVFLLLILVSGCSDRSKTGAGSQTVIQVDDHVLTLAEFNEFFEPLRMSYAKVESKHDPSLREARLRFLLQLVDEMIILRRAQELHLYVSPQELEEALGNIKGDYGEDSFKAVFMKQAISLKTWKQRLERQLLVEKVINKELLEQFSVTPEEIRDYYDKHKDEWTHGEQIRVYHILLPSKDLANRVSTQLKKGEDFATLASLHSIAPESKLGGDMGYVQRGHLPKCLEAPMFASEKDKVSPVIKTPFGYHIFKVVEKEPAGKSKMDDWMEKTRERVLKEKVEIAYGPWLAKLRSRYGISVSKEFI